MKQVCRRDILVLAVAWATLRLLTFVPVSAARTQTAENEPIRFRWQVPAPYVGTVRQNLKYEGSEKPEADARGGPLVVFVGAVLLVYLAEAVLALRREIVTGGVVIDTRGPQIEIKNDPRLESKWLIVIGPTESKVYRKDELGGRRRESRG